MKKKNMILSFVLAILTCVSAVGCSSATTETSNNSAFTPRGTHYENNSASNYYLIKDYKTDYKILAPAEPTKYETLAIELINDYVFKSVGIKFPVVTSNETITADSAKYISVGDTSIMRKSGLSVSYEKYGDCGFRLVTLGDDVFIAGARSALREGTYYGAQEFLYYIMDWRAYALDEIKYDIKDSIKLINFDVVEIPEFNGRSIGSHNVRESEEYQRLLRSQVSSDTFIPELSGHSHFEILPPKTYYPEHPEWYVFEDGYNYLHEQAFFHGQICLSNPELIEEFSIQVAKLFNKYPTTNTVHLGQMDTQKVACKCDGCLKQQEGTNFSGSMVIFVNKVARRVAEIIQQTQPDRQLYFRMFAYQKTLPSPTHEENGVLVADKPEVIPDKNVTVQFCPDSAKSAIAMEDERNAEYFNHLKGWKVVTDKIDVWIYNVNFETYYISNKNWDIMLQNIRTFSENGVTRMYLQSHIWRQMNTMAEMRMWVESKLMWNSSLDYMELAYEFMENYYGITAPIVKEAYDSTTTYYEYLHRNYDLAIGTFYTNINRPDCWSFAFVESIRKTMEKGFTLLDTIKDEPAEYDKYYWRFANAYFENLFMQMEYYRAEYGKEYCEQAINLFESIMQRYGYNYTGDRSSMTFESYVAKWRGTYGL